MALERNPHPRTAVLIGVGQLSQRVDRGEPELEPVDLMAEALRRAGHDTGRSGVLEGADSVRTIAQLSWRYRDPGALVAERVGARPRETTDTVMGGNYVQTVLNRTALDIRDNQADLVLLCGGEAWRTNRAYKRRGERPAWTRQPDEVRPTRRFGDHDPDLAHPEELARGISAPIQVYPMFENALRAAQGLGIDEHRQRIAALWSGFSAVAARNPHAWIRQELTADEIARPTAENRMVGWPYTKRMNSNNAVEQAAGLVVCSVERAHELGIPADRWVFLHAGADAHDHWFLSHRADLCSSPALRLAGSATLELAGIGVDDLAHVDLYSCFPSAVQIAAHELGLGLDRTLTVTGGMSFAGGPWNNYVMHAVATMVDRLRADPGSRGLVTANGGYTTKHALGVYSTAPPPDGAFAWVNPQSEVDRLPSRELCTDHAGDVTIETYTVMHDRDGEPELAPVACLLGDGRRCWAHVADPDAMRAMTREEHVGRRAVRGTDGELEIG